ncbi:MAG: diguanylate cyclase [Treponemataceae bacterium]
MTTEEQSIDLLETQNYDLRKTIEIARQLSEEEHLHTLIHLILEIMQDLSESGAGLFIQPSMDSHVFSLTTHHIDLDIENDREYKIDASNPSIRLLAELNAPCTLDDLKAKLKNDSGIDAFISLKPDLIIPLCARSLLIGIIVLGSRKKPFNEKEKELIITLAPFFAMNLYTSMLIEMTTTDMMTKLKLKHYFYTVLFEKLEMVIGKQVPISVLMLDIDFFKKVNDTYGHDCGDYVLKEVASTVKSCIRGEDMAGRYGGEEFVVMLYEIDQESAMQVAERIRKAVEDLDLTYGETKIKVTISIGVSCSEDKIILSAREMVNYADQALYESKHNGRNRVTFCNIELIMANLKASLLND